MNKLTKKQIRQVRGILEKHYTPEEIMHAAMAGILFGMMFEKGGEKKIAALEAVLKKVGVDLRPERD